MRSKRSKRRINLLCFLQYRFHFFTYIKERSLGRRLAGQHIKPAKNMKKLISAILLIAAAIFVSSCGFVNGGMHGNTVNGDHGLSDSADTGNTPVSRVESVTEEKSDTGTVYVNTITDKVTIDGDAAVLELSITSPTFSRASDATNASIKKIAEDFASEADIYAAEAEELGRKNMLFAPYVFEMLFETVYSDENTVSVKIQKYCYLGGAHGSTEYEGITLSLKTGEILSAEEISGLSADGLKTAVTDGFRKIIDKSPDEFYPNASEQLNEKYNELVYYLTDQGLEFLFQEYMIAPYAAGPIVFVLKY